MASVSFEEVTKRFGQEVVAVDHLSLDVNEGEFLILVGPSGCGKTTALRMVAGLEEVTSGEIKIGERVVTDIAPTDRDIAMVFQNYALYPHMSVADNIAFPLRQHKIKKAEIRTRVAEAARLLSITELLNRKPRELSGGQRQRVAIGRALVRRPEAFLMDEPLSNLDAKLRVQMRAELLSLHERLGITTIYVTHDQTEAMTLGDRVVVLDRGVVQQVDAPDRLYLEPANIFVAGFIGSPAMNFLNATLDESTVQIGSYRFTLPERTRQALRRPAGEIIVGVRPEHFVLAPPNDEGEQLAAVVAITEQLGPEMLVHFSVAGLAPAEVAPHGEPEEPSSGSNGHFVARVDPGFSASRGEHLRVGLNTERIQIFDPASGESLLQHYIG
jgi:multiple sugar transport system ATP-binding protein